MTNRTCKMTADDWKKTTWEGNRRAKIKRWAALTLDEILTAQEEMADLAEKIAAAKTLPGNKSAVYEKPAVYKTKPASRAKKTLNNC
jgi:hypothetical protein